MEATETLKHEHRVIEQVASACGICAEAMRDGTKIPTDVLESIVGFFEQYGDRYHRQEEEALLSMLGEKGISAGSPIAVIQYENQKPKVLVGQLSSAVRAYVKSNGAVSGTLIDMLKALAEFFPDHFWKEDSQLLPMAEKVLSEKDKSSLADSLNRIESRKGAEAQCSVEKFSTSIHRWAVKVARHEQAYAA